MSKTNKKSKSTKRFDSSWSTGKTLLAIMLIIFTLLNFLITKENSNKPEKFMGRLSKIVKEENLPVSKIILLINKERAPVTLYYFDSENNPININDFSKRKISEIPLIENHKVNSFRVEDERYLLYYDQTLEGSRLLILYDTTESNLYQWVNPLWEAIALTIYLISYLVLILNKKRGKILEENRRLGLEISLLSSLTHELKTPLTSIIGYSDLINISKVNAEVIEMNHEISEQAWRLNHRVNQLLEIAKLNLSDRREVEIKKLPVIIEDELSLLSASQRERIVLKEFKSDVEYDSLIFGLLISNILSNFIKYSQGGVLKISTLQRGKRVWLVFNNSKNEQEELLLKYKDSFHLVDEFISESKGLGLYIIKKASSAIGVDVWVDKDFNYIIEVK